VRRAREAGKFYDLRIPLAADYTVGRGWAEAPINTITTAPEQDGSMATEQPDLPLAPDAPTVTDQSEYRNHEFEVLREDDHYIVHWWQCDGADAPVHYSGGREGPFSTVEATIEAAKRAIDNNFNAGLSDEETFSNGGEPPPWEKLPAHVCARCKLDPPNGTERLSAYGALWLHPGCEDAVLRERLVEEGISDPPSPPLLAVESPAPAPEPACDPEPPDEPSPPPPAPNGGGSSSGRPSPNGAGKPYAPIRARLLAQGYRLAHSFEFKLPDGAVLFVEDRYELTALNGKLPHKTIRFRHAVNGRTFADTGPRRIVFNWPAIMVAGPGVTVFIVEGAYKATPLIAAGLLATAAPYHQWGPECSGALAGRHLVYLEDHDCPDTHGRRKAKELSADAQAKLSPGAASFRTIPALLLWKELGRTDEPPHGWDIRDWMDAGGSAARLRAVCDQVSIPSTSAELESVCLADLEMQNYDWMWPDRFALGEIGLLTGLPDVGKGQILAYIASRVTRGLAWPNGEGQAPLGNVVILTSEDNLKKTVYPRFEAAGADCKRIHAIKMVGDINPKTGKPAKRMLSLATDLERLRAKIVAVGNVIAVLIDPITAYLGIGTVDSYRTSDVRAVLGPLKDLAEEMNVAVIGIMHFNKKVDVTNVLLRVSDSLAFVAAPRHVFGVIYDPENNRTLVVSAKNNLADAEQKRKSLAYHFEVKQVGVDRKGKPIERPFIVWNPGYVDVSATEALSAASENKAPAAVNDAKDFLRGLMTAGGRKVPRAEIEEAADAEGISERTLWRAKKALGIKAEKDKTANGQWIWVMPDDEGGQF
jgi:hypothetical protein